MASLIMTRVALFWHMHQPFYQDLVTGEHILPWVRLHALKDYWGMVALLREFPSVKCTFNLVPSLLVQVEAFAEDKARDRHLELGLKPAASLTDEERAYCLENFFHAQRHHMIDPNPRYAELLAKRGTNSGLSARSTVNQFSVEDLRDLQVWHKLVWVDYFYFERDERVRALVAKGRDFTEEDKLTLRAVELEILQQVVPEYRAASARGQVELSTSPFYHPILPLLCDTDIYLKTHPQSRMPRERFRRPEDASEQLARAVALHERLFGRKPEGLWPSEGSVSDDMVPLVARSGFRWMATDEGILSKTLGRAFTRTGDGHVEQPELLYRAYRVGQPTRSVAIGFRDHTLSDLIGFSYASWSADGAADDFVRRLVEGGRRFPRNSSGEEATIFVILDGENAWEHYDRQGRPFLRALYHRLGTHPELTTVTMAEACGTAHELLRSVFPGSWIHSDFYIWIGHPDDHRAWTQLAEARRALDAPPPGLPRESLAQAQDEMLIAEGSDWFWWYGDDHSSSHDLEFDELFRRHVRNVYRALDKPIPEELFVTNITTDTAGVEVHRPTGFVEPVIDGEVTSYFEWLGAGCVDETAAVGAMHQVAERAPGVALIEFGFDLDRLFIRVDGSRSMKDMLGEQVELSVNFLKPSGVRVLVRTDAHGRPSVTLVERSNTGSWDRRECTGMKAAVRAVLELEIPFRCLHVHTHDPVAFIVALNRDDAEVEHYPRHRPIELDVPDEHFAALNWTA
jgi:alpha-amylase/alpha-mannosidase (GH57 family)